MSIVFPGGGYFIYFLGSYYILMLPKFIIFFKSQLFDLQSFIRKEKFVQSSS